MYNYLLKYFGNGTVQLTYYHNAILKKEDRSPTYISLQHDEKVRARYLEENELEAYIDEMDATEYFEQMKDLDGFQWTPFGYIPSENVDIDIFARNDSKKDLTPEEIQARKQRSIDVSLSRSKKMIIDYGRANVWHWFFTLTFERVDGFNAENYVEASAKVREWFKNIRKRYCPNLKYLAVPEMHESGAWHFHCLVANCDELTFKHAVNNQPYLKDKQTRKVIRDKKGQPVPNQFYKQKLRTSYPDGDYIYNIANYKSGFSTATKVKDTKKAVSYIIKYITKELCEITFHKRRYLPSNNLDLPIKSYGYSDPKDLMELITDIEYTYGLKLSIDYIKTYDVSVENYENTISVLEFATPVRGVVPEQAPSLCDILERIYG